MKDTSARKAPKKRYWAAVVYPDSAPSDWKDILQGTGLKVAISPLHDKDVDPTGITKKPHWHVILCYDGPTTYANVLTVTDALNAPAPQPLESIVGYYRYLTHKDNPDKAQYAESEIVALNGFAASDYIEITRTEISSIKKQLIQFIRDYCITEYSDFMDLVIAQCDAASFDVASSNTLFFDRYISSSRHKMDAKGDGR